MLSLEEQLDTLRRGVDAVVPDEEFVAKLDRSIKTGRPLRVKYGIDPTGIDVHLGHTVPLRKLRQFQDLGHVAVIIIGNYTALVGDPSGRDETRLALTEAQVEANAKDYLRQVGRIIDLGRAEVHHNGDWFSKWSFLDVLDLTRKMTLGQISARDDFAKRIAAEKPVYLHECLYPLMQGWDSVEIKADVELGGSEQLFSLMVARGLQQGQGQPAQVAMTMPILVGTDGTRRMGKSLGNYIGVAEDPVSQFAKIMSIPDAPMRQYFTLLTDLPLAEVDRWLDPSINPRDAKEALGKAVVTQYSGAEAAEHASLEFRRRAKREDPDEIPDVAAKFPTETAGPMFLPNLIVNELKFDASTSNVRRMIEQKGVTIGAERLIVVDGKAVVEPLAGQGKVRLVQADSIHVFEADDFIVRYGKRKIARVRFEA